MRYGPLCAYRLVDAAVIMPAGNSDAMSEHLSEGKINTPVSPDTHAVFVCDGPNAM
jgi:hypothetical protein